MKYFIRILMVFLLFLSCKENDREQVVRLVEEWNGKEIQFPKNMIFTRFVTDTISYKIPKAEYKVIIYVDSIGCTNCKLQLFKWKELITYIDSQTNSKIPFLFIFQSKDDNELRNILKRNNFNRLICVDRENKFCELNHFPLDITFQTFLLNRDNKVIIIGNPIHNLKVKDLYLKILTGKTNLESKMIKTTAKAVNADIDFKSFPKSEVKTAILEIRNTGNNTLVIMDVSTTCGCVAATYDRIPAKPGDILRVSVMITPKETGFFDEIVTIRCNTNKPVKVKIRGNVHEEQKNSITSKQMQRVI